MSEELQDITYSIAVSPNYVQDGLCFVARGSGLNRSNDGGQTWHDAYASLNLDSPLTTVAVAISPGFSTDRTVFAGVVGGILRSFDAGSSWQVVGLPAQPVISALVISPNYLNDGTLLAAAVADGVFRSADRGSRWTAWNFGLLDLNVLCMAISPNFAHDETLFVGTETGIFRSTNGGRAWREADAPSAQPNSAEFAPVLSLAISPHYASDGTLFAGADSNGLFCSTDRGRTWTRIGANVLTGSVNALVLSSDVPAPGKPGPGFPDMLNILALTDDALLISRDGGEAWAEWQVSLKVEPGLTTVAAPLGLGTNAPLLVGLADGEMLIRGDKI